MKIISVIIGVLAESARSIEIEFFGGEAGGELLLEHRGKTMKATLTPEDGRWVISDFDATSGP